MSLVGRLTVDLGAIVRNWRALDGMTGAETAAVLKADAYGCGAPAVAKALAAAGVRTLFVAVPEEGLLVRAAVGRETAIYVLGGWPLADADTWAFRHSDLRPVLNSPEQVSAWVAAGSPGQAALQLDTGMNRLGLEPAELAAVGVPDGVTLVMSHMGCAGAPDHPMNTSQLKDFLRITHEVAVPRSLAATGGTLMGGPYAFDMVRPGVGLYGGLPFAAADAVVTLRLPILQVRHVAAGEAVGYDATWVAERPSRIATLSGGYADGLHRMLSSRAEAFVDGVACPFAGRVSMDLIGLDVTDAPAAHPGAWAEILGPNQPIDRLAEAAGTIGYEVLTSLGSRYERRYLG